MNRCTRSWIRSATNSALRSRIRGVTRSTRNRYRFYRDPVNRRTIHNAHIHIPPISRLASWRSRAPRPRTTPGWHRRRPHPGRFSVSSERDKVGYSALEVFPRRPLNPFIKRDSLNDYSSLYSPRMNQITKFLLPRIVRGLPASIRRRSSEKLGAEIAAWTRGRYIASNARCSTLIGIDLEELGYESIARICRRQHERDSARPRATCFGPDRPRDAAARRLARPAGVRQRKPTLDKFAGCQPHLAGA